MSDPTPTLEWGVAAQSYPGERACGDRHFIADFDGGVMAGVVDGLGHGHEAEHAARLACDALQRRAGRRLTEAVSAAHEELRGSRGVALSVAAIDPAGGAVTWLGVGNVEAVLYRSRGGPREVLVPRAGVVGYQLPSLRQATVPMMVGDTLVMATDGVAARFAQAEPRGASAQSMAHAVLDAYGRRDDDALVLVGRLLEHSS